MATINERFDRDGQSIGWQTIVRRKGHPSQTRTFRTRREADLWAATIEAAVGHGTFVDHREAEKTSFATLLDRYRREITPQKRGEKAEVSKLRVIERHPITRRAVAGITGADLAGYRDDRLREVSPGTVNCELNIISHIFAIAITEWQIDLPRGNPVAAMRRPRSDAARTRRLQEGEEDRLIAAALQYEVTPKALRMTSIITLPLATATAMRRGEIIGMTWQHVDLPGRTIHLPETKNGSARSIPLSRAAIAVLESLPRRIDGWVWGANIDPHSITTAFDRICTRAKIENLRFHDLRHEAISRLFERTDLTEMEIARISGHKTMMMLSRYTHLRAGHIADRLDGKRRGG